MPHPEFMLLLQDIYLSLLNGVEGLQEQGRVILDILASVDSSVPPQRLLIRVLIFVGYFRPHKSADASLSIQDELSDILSSAAELSNTQAAKVITHRADQHAALELADFLVFFNESWGFVVRCEVICRKMIVGLRGAVVSQVISIFLYSGEYLPDYYRPKYFFRLSIKLVSRSLQNSWRTNNGIHARCHPLYSTSPTSL